MLEANVLYSVTAAVVLGLLTWVAFVSKTAKEPWSRVIAKPEGIADAPIATPAHGTDEPPKENADM